MATPTTLLEYAQQQRTVRLQDRTDAKGRVTQAQQRQSEARTNHDTATKAFADLEKTATEIRKKLAEIPTPADGDALIDDLEETLIALRTSQATILAAEETNAAAQSQLDRATGDLKAADTRLAEAATALAETEQQNDRRNEGKTALGLPPLSTLPAIATGALSGQPFTAAQTHIEGDIPAALITRARNRREAESKRIAATKVALTDAEDLLRTEKNTKGGLTGKVAALQVDFLRQEVAFFAYVLQAKERHERALAHLIRLADPDKPKLTDAQKARITDATRKTAREEAATKEKARDDARVEVETKQAALDKAILKAQAADLNADPNTDADVVAAKTALNTATTALTAAETAYTAATQKVLDTWEAAVPESTWRDLADFEEAKEILNLLKDTTPGTLVTNLNTAESVLVTALVTADKSARTLRFLQERTVEEAARGKIMQSVAPRRLFSALRGDR